MVRYCNRLTKANFNERMTEALKKLSTKKKKNALDLGNKKRAKTKKTLNVGLLSSFKFITALLMRYLDRKYHNSCCTSK